MEFRRDRVMQANRYRGSYALESLGDADKMLIRQYRFPDTYNPQLDIVNQADHDRLIYEDYKRTTEAFAKHTGSGEINFHSFARNAEPEKILDFLKEVMPQQSYPGVKWTGFRILGTKNRMNGFTVWSFELFAKGKDSDTKVYSTDDAPNVAPRAKKRRVMIDGQVIEDDISAGGFY